MKQQTIIEEILKERKRQDDKWGAQRYQSDEHWLAILAEEFGEVAQCVCKTRIPPIDPQDVKEYNPRLTLEIIQCCAVLFAWLESK